MGKFVKGHKKLGGRKPGGTKAEINLKNAILGALEAVNGQAYLEAVAKDDPRTFCSLLSRVLPLTVVGDATKPVRYEVTLAFGSERERTVLESEDAVQDGISGPAADIKALVHMRSS